MIPVCNCHVTRLPNRRTGEGEVHAETCPVAIPETFTLRDAEPDSETERWFNRGAAALTHEPLDSEHSRLVAQVNRMADLLDELSVVLVGVRVEDWHVLAPMARRWVALSRSDGDAQLRDAMHALTMWRR
jgi:hypothetical protein